MTPSIPYETIVTTYTNELRSLFQSPEPSAPTRSITRGGQNLTSEVLADRVEQLQLTSRQLGDTTAQYLTADDQRIREAAELKLLAQASAEFEIVQALLEAANADSPSTATTRSGTGTINIQASLDELARVIETPIDHGVQPPTTRSTTRSATATRSISQSEEPEQAKQQLQEQVQQSVQSICKQAGTVGGRAAQTLVLIDVRALQQGAALISKDLSEAVEQLVSGLAAGIKRLVGGAMRLLLQAYDWVLALLGKDIEQQARKQVADWITELKTASPNEEGEGLIARLVNRIYTPETIPTELEQLLASTSARVDVVSQAATTVRMLAETYKTKTDHVEKFLKVIALAKVAPIPWAKTPQFQLILAAIALGLLGYTLYAGYDYLDDGQVQVAQRLTFSIPNRVQGVRQVVRAALAS